jgi:hypothetical protein
MKKLLISVISIVTYNISIAQDSIPRLSFEFGYNQHQFAMDTLNIKLIDAAINSSVKLLDERIESGFGLHFKLGYLFTKYFQFGIFGDFQRGVSEYNPMMPMGNNPPVEGIYSVKVESLTAGINGTFWINSLIQNTNNVLLKNLNYGISINLGYGVGAYKNFSYYPTNPLAVSRQSIRMDKTMHYQVEFKSEYLITKKHLFSSLGFKVGYQYFKTDYLKTQANEYEILVGYPNSKVQLDFSGFYFGIYLKLSR